MDGDCRRPRVRLAWPAARHRRGLRLGRRQGAVRARLRRRLDQGHEPRSVRPAPQLKRAIRATAPRAHGVWDNPKAWARGAAWLKNSASSGATTSGAAWWLWPGIVLRSALGMSWAR